MIIFLINRNAVRENIYWLNMRSNHTKFNVVRQRFLKWRRSRNLAENLDKLLNLGSTDIKSKPF